MHIRGLGQQLPPHYATQAELTQALMQLYGQQQPHNVARLASLHQSMQITGRHTALPLSAYPKLQTFAAANDAFIDVGTELAVASAQAALAQAGLAARDVDHLFFVSVTGIATPSIDARLMNRLGLKSQVKRTPIFGLGCVAGAAGTARLADSLRAFPREAGLLVSVELCSLTLQRRDLSVANLVASGLFGDAAAALAMVGTQHPKAAAGVPSSLPQILATRAVFYPNTEELMGWRISGDGFGIVLSARVPEVVERFVCHDVDKFLADHKLLRSDIDHYLLHPGGPKIIDAMQKTLGLNDADVALGRNNLATYGNVSSTAVLLMLAELCAQPNAPVAGSYGLMLAMGPGFCAEMVLLRW